MTHVLSTLSGVDQVVIRRDDLSIRSGQRKKFSHQTIVPFSLFPEWHMTRSLMRYPFGFSDPVEQGGDDEVLRYVITPIDDVRRYTDEVESIDDGPVAQQRRRHRRTAAL